MSKENAWEIVPLTPSMSEMVQMLSTISDSVTLPPILKGRYVNGMKLRAERQRAEMMA